ncbi:hypothetical protein K2173_006353 [Erythroxylum novogranatense]|uniref:Zinc knuckle CX2CX4HX4C domain-containing protein n=1 Tax=Erythroxylum novogranatense TaxID=1862640 RepID=A0AAV8U774_9ROSI|nr:hypothetical protein K2173_006353 [Erythroxylum novogranatense]
MANVLSEGMKMCESILLLVLPRTRVKRIKRMGIRESKTSSRRFEEVVDGECIYIGNSSTVRSSAVIGGPRTAAVAEPIFLPEDQPVDIKEGDITPVIGEQGRSPPNGESLLVTYEGLPQVCYTCGIVGHSPTTYTRNSTASTVVAPPPDPQIPRESDPSEQLAPGEERLAEETSNGYGPWTNVPRRCSRTGLKGQKLQAEQDSCGGPTQDNSRYAVLDQEASGLELEKTSGSSTQVGLEGLGRRVQVEV